MIFCSHIAINVIAMIQCASCQWVSTTILHCEAAENTSFSVDIAALPFADKIFWGSINAYSMKLLGQNFKISPRSCSVKSWSEVSFNDNFDGCRFENEDHITWNFLTKNLKSFLLYEMKSWPIDYRVWQRKSKIPAATNCKKPLREVGLHVIWGHGLIWTARRKASFKV